MVRALGIFAGLAAGIALFTGCGGGQEGSASYDMASGDASSETPAYAGDSYYQPAPQEPATTPPPGDRFAAIRDNQPVSARQTPLSTFSIDVDTASYTKTRMYITQQATLPPADAVRIEEMINYFSYNYPQPTDNHPIAAHVEVASCPWQQEHRLVKIGVQGKQLEQRPVSNLVFLLDVSGSIHSHNKLPCSSMH